MPNEFFAELIENIKKANPSKNSIGRLKQELCKKYHIAQPPTDIEILTNADEKDLSVLKKLLLTKPTRTISGVAVIALMTKPFPCPHGKCIYCPGGVKSALGNVPQSYTGHEPATLRAIRANYDPYIIVFNRLEQYIVAGHSPEKIEMIIMGGTFLSFPKKYQEDFITYSYKALNDFSREFYPCGKFDFVKFKKFFELPGKVGDEKRTVKIQKKILKLKKKSTLEKEKLRNEKAKTRCVALCIETRPDWCKHKHINEMLRFGATRVELGVQNLSEKILKEINRGHTVADIIEATQLMKDALLKVGYHMMPGLPGVSREQDIDNFRQLFSNPDFKPDALKIYPCMVFKGTKLYTMWKKGWYKPLTTDEAADIISEAKRFVPKYCRIMRVNRDIPTKISSAGIGNTNLRQTVDEYLRMKGIKCKCIRCREPKGKNIDLKSLKILVEKYAASGGIEYFISAEDVKNDILVGFCRLRIKDGKAGVRELHVYSQALPLGGSGSLQHRGIGTSLMKEAEKIAKANKCKKISVISGVGVREYYKKKLRYKNDGFYVSKRI